MTPTPPLGPRFPAQPVLQGWIETATALYREELGRDPDPSGLATTLLAFARGGTAETERARLRRSTEWQERQEAPGPPRPAPPSPAPRPPIDRARLRGAFCLPTMPRRVWWPAFLAVDEAEQDRYIAETQARGYTFGQILVSGLPYGTDYPEIPLDAGRLRAGLQKLRAAGLITIIATDDRRGPDQSYLRDVLVPNRDLIDWSMWVYECNGVFKDPAKVLTMLQTGRDLLPDCLSAVHFEPLNEGFESHGLVDWHRAQQEAGLNALFLQLAAWKQSMADNVARVQDFTRRLGGPGFHGYPTLSHGVYVYELTTSLTYRGQLGEVGARIYTDTIMNAPLDTDEGVAAVRPSGFGDGGTP